MTPLSAADADIDQLDAAAIDALFPSVTAFWEDVRYNKSAFFEPYAPQKEFFALGAVKRERLMMAGNQVGKSEAGAYEMTCHLTGVYPKWWEGRRFGHPVRAWAGGEGGLLVRDVSQAKLCGRPGSDEEFGTGAIPRALLIGKTAGHGVSDGYDSIQVRHGSGGISTLAFKSYEQGRTRWQGATLDVIWLDEEPPIEIYSEALARLTGKGMLFSTLTPLLGETAFIRRFLADASPEALRDRGVVRMGLKHAEHFTAGEKEQRLAGYPAHERAARENGDPLLSGGAVWAGVSEKDITRTMPLSRVPSWWRLLWGLDFGIAHPFAAVLLAHDTETDEVCIVHTLRISGGIPITHAAQMRKIAASVPVAWPHDGNQRDKGSGEQLASIYRDQGLRMLPVHATHATGGYATEAGILDILERMHDQRFFVAAHLADWFEEFRAYRRDKTGLIVKIRDDLMSATRIGMMMLREAKASALGPGMHRGVAKLAAGVGDFKPW